MLRFIKVAPTTDVLDYQDGRIRREGAGLSFFYWEPTTTIVAVPIGSTTCRLSSRRLRPISKR